MITVTGSRMNRQLTLAHVPGEHGITTIRVVASDGLMLTTNAFILDVRAIPLSLAGLTVEDKEYDGGTAATVSSYGTLVGVQPGHDVTLNTSGARAIFDTPNVGASKSVTVADLALIGADAASYSIADQITTATVLAKALTAIADDKIRGYGQTNPVLTVTYNGFASGDDARALDDQPAAETVATIDSPAGVYAITVVGGLDGNYQFIRVDGTLTITNVPPVILSLTSAGDGRVAITWSTVSNQTYRLLYTDDLQSGNWLNQLPDVTAVGPTATTTNAATTTRRFYRVVQLP